MAAIVFWLSACGDWLTDGMAGGAVRWYEAADEQVCGMICRGRACPALV